MNEVDELFSAEAPLSDDSDSAEGVYFTKYARKFFGDREKEADAWGLVTAPLGKKSNIGNFYYGALSGILWDNTQVKNELTERIEVYQQVRREFLEQRDKVETLRAKLSQYAEKSQKLYDMQQEQNALQKHYHEQKEKHEAALHDLESQITQRQSDMLDAGKRQINTGAAVLNAEKLVSRIKTEVETRISEKNGYIYDVQQVDADITVWNKIFRS